MNNNLANCKTLLFFLLFFSSNYVIGDQIFLKNNMTISGKILRVTDTSIEYDPEGDIPWNKTSRMEVLKIIYDNGVTVMVEEEIAPQKPPVPVKNEAYDEEEEYEKEKPAGTKENIEPIENSELPEIEKEKTTTYKNTMEDFSEAKKRNLTLELITGWNSSVGFGPKLDYKIMDAISINSGIGYGLWGFRISNGLRYYFSFPYGMAAGIYYGYNTGIKDFKTKLNVEQSGTTVDKDDVHLELKGVSTIDLTMLYNWKIFESSRMFFEFGYSLPFEKNGFQVKGSDILSSQGKDTVKMMSPGGIIIAFGVCFKLF